MEKNKKKASVKKIQVKKKFPPIVYGLQGIMYVFQVSRNTAFKLRHTILDGACTQRGRILIVDVKEALRLFGMKDTETEKLIEKKTNKSNDKNNNDEKTLHHSFPSRDSAESW